MVRICFIDAQKQRVGCDIEEVDIVGQSAFVISAFYVNMAWNDNILE